MREYQILACASAQKLTDVLSALSKDGWRPIGFVMRRLGNALETYETLLEREVIEPLGRKVGES